MPLIQYFQLLFIYLFIIIYKKNYIFCHQVEVRTLEGGCVTHHTIINIFLFLWGDRADLSSVLLLRLS